MNFTQSWSHRRTILYTTENCPKTMRAHNAKPKPAAFVQLKRKKADADEADEEERALSVIANLFQGLGRGSRRDRLAAKFVESEFEKCDRLVELFNRYTKRVQMAEVSLSIISWRDTVAKLQFYFTVKAFSECHAAQCLHSFMFKRLGFC